ncbi:MAG: glycosyltransferase [Thermoplasmatota archaeon]
MRVALIEKPSRTGIGSYVSGLQRYLPPDIDVSVCKVWKWEAKLGGLRVGGSFTESLRRLATPIPPDADLVHATSHWTLVGESDVMTIHDFNPLHVPGQPLIALMFRLMAPRIRTLRAVITVSEAVRREAIERYRLDPRRVHAIHQGIGPEWSPDLSQPLPWDGPTVAYLGDYRSYKGIEATVAAVAKIPGLHLMRMGPPAYGAYSRRVVRQAHALLGSRFHDLGYLPQPAVRQALSQSALLAFPSRHEGFGLPPLEAAACGVPSVLLDTAVNQEIHGLLAHYVERASPDVLSEALRHALRDPIPASALQENAARFSWKRTAERTATLYRLLA